MIMSFLHALDEQKLFNESDMSLTNHILSKELSDNGQDLMNSTSDMSAMKPEHDAETDLFGKNSLSVNGCEH